jgi:hypothetical protein
MSGILRRVDHLSPGEGGGTRVDCAYKAGDRVRHADIPMLRGTITEVKGVSGPVIFYTVEVDADPGGLAPCKSFITRAFYLKPLIEGDRK